MSENRGHVSVLYQEILDSLAPRDGGRYIDGTLGAGGHAKGILQAAFPTGRLLGLDADASMLPIAAATLGLFGERAILVHSNFARLLDVAAQEDFLPVDGIVLDLGISSIQLSDAARGFSFLTDGALDMRLNTDAETTAADLVNSLDETSLANLIFRYGEERASRRIARAIVRARPLTTAAQLAQVIEKAVGRHGRMHPATRTFQAVRIAVNAELQVLEAVLPQIAPALAPGGRIAIISFHSLEDRIVKNFFRASKELKIVTKRPICPTETEIDSNPKSRSAKLRVAEKVG
jgi:16S rRNA (cytosine1402-N4)-methyltransferase